jgi:membrane protein YqaA with SNARE-associated domain
MTYLVLPTLQPERKQIVSSLLAFGYAGVFLFALALNLIPFAGPSNLFIAGVAAISIPGANFLTVGLLVALGSSTAKMIHFCIAFFTSRILNDSQRQKLDNHTKNAGKIGPLLIFLSAATPIPDDPVVIPLGLMKYNPLKFFIIYFIGKSTITVSGAYLGLFTKVKFSGLMDEATMAVISIVVTVVATVLLLKVDLSKSLAGIARRLGLRGRDSAPP